MAKVKVTIKGREKLSRVFKSIPEGSRQATTKALKMSALLVQNSAKVNAPVDTGRLRSSITHNSDDKKAVIGTNVEYAPHVEYGHRTRSGSHVPAVLFLTRAYRSNERRIKRLFRKILQKDLKKRKP